LVVVRDVRTNLGYVGSPEFLKLLVRFKATFRNSGNTDIRVAPEPIFMSGVQRQDETGEWRTLQAHHWYDFGQNTIQDVHDRSARRRLRVIGG